MTELSLTRPANYSRERGKPELSFLVVNPTNGHAHYVYLLRGSIRIDGAVAGELAAAIERAHTALRTRMPATPDWSSTFRSARVTSRLSGGMSRSRCSSLRSSSCPRWRRGAKPGFAPMAATSRRSADFASGRTRRSASIAAGPARRGTRSSAPGARDRRGSSPSATHWPPFAPFATPLLGQDVRSA
jgi:hypothetical protein